MGEARKCHVLRHWHDVTMRQAGTLRAEVGAAVSPAGSQRTRPQSCSAAPDWGIKSGMEGDAAANWASLEGADRAAARVPSEYRQRRAGFVVAGGLRITFELSRSGTAKWE